MDLAAFAGADFADVTLDGQTYRVGELTLAEWAPVQAWIKAKVPGPLAILESKEFPTLPQGIKREIVQEAIRLQRTSWPPQLGTVEWFAAIDHDGGHAVALLAMLQKHQPMTPARAAELAARCNAAELIPAVAAALGLTGPKSPAPATPTTGPTGPTGPTTTSDATTSATSPINSPTHGDGHGTMSWH